MVRSTIGGTLRLRSYVELEGEGLTVAEGDCPNPLYAPADVKEPLLAKSLTTKPKLGVKKVYEYDLQTEVGGEYHIFKKGEMTGIRDVERGELNVERVYDLQGRQVSHPKEGLYIRNGKKVITQ